MLQKYNQLLSLLLSNQTFQDKQIEKQLLRHFFIFSCTTFLSNLTNSHKNLE